MSKKNGKGKNVRSLLETNRDPEMKSLLSVYFYVVCLSQKKSKEIACPLPLQLQRVQNNSLESITE